MIQEDGLNDAMRADALPAVIRAAFVPPNFQAPMACGDGEHVVTVVEGIPLRAAHDSEDERALTALGGEAPFCVFLRQAIVGALGGGPQPVRTPAPARVRQAPIWARLAALANMRAAVVAQAWLSPEREISKHVRTQSRPNMTLPRDLRVTVGDGPALRARRKTTSLVLARDWAATAWLWGYMKYEDHVVAGLKTDGDYVILARLRTDGDYRLEEVTAPLQGIRLIR